MGIYLSLAMLIYKEYTCITAYNVQSHKEP